MREGELKLRYPMIGVYSFVHAESFVGKRERALPQLMKSRTKPVILLMALLLSVVAGIASLQRKAETGPNAIRDAWVNDHWKEISQIMKDQKTSISFKETNEIEVLSVEYERATTGARALRQLGPPCPVVPVLQVASHAEAKNAMAQPIKPVRVRVNPSAYQADLARGAQVEFD